MLFPTFYILSKNQKTAARMQQKSTTFILKSPRIKTEVEVKKVTIS